MKLFQASDGTIFSFGFDMNARYAASHKICWNDPATGDWLAAENNDAGSLDYEGANQFQFIRELADGLILAYRPGSCLEIQKVGRPLVYSFRTLKADQP